MGIFYKIRHNPTGMFYCPSRHVKKDFDGKTKYVKSNLSTKGKIYEDKPSLKWTETYYNPDDQDGGYSGNIRQSTKDEFEIIEIK